MLQKTKLKKLKVMKTKTTGTQLNSTGARQSASKNWAAAELGIGLHAAQTIPLIKSK